MKRNRFPLLVMAALAIASLAGLVRLFHLRFEQGDIYPPYSSLRADPLGTRAFFDSLDNLSTFTVRRNFKPVSQLGNEARQTVFLLGVPADQVRFVPEIEARQLEQLAASGDRLVIALRPVLARPATRRDTMTDPHRPIEKADTKKTGDEDETERQLRPISLPERWGYEVSYRLEATNAVWHTALFFDNPGPKWRVVETRGKCPAIIERGFGSGSIVLCADSYFVSNEALRRERHPELLAAVLGPNREIVFDETHLGVNESPGVMTLARKYRLQGLLAGLFLLAVLFIWQSTASFVPPYTEDEAGAAAASGKESAAGFVNLLRRTIAPSRILSVCVEEWNQSFAYKMRQSAEKRERIRAVVAAQESLPARQRDPVASYHQIARILKERK